MQGRWPCFHSKQILPGLSVHTIDTYRDNIKRELSAGSGVELQRQALQRVMENR